MARRPAATRRTSGADLTRRRVLVALTLVVGTVLLGAALRTRAASPEFFGLALAGATVWIVGGLASGGVPLGWSGRPAARARGLVIPAGIGAALYLAFVVADLVAREVPVLAHALDHILANADHGSLLVIVAVATVSAVGEEVFFRGALYSAIGPQHPAEWTTVIYVLVTIATGNLALVAAAAVLGTVTSLERRATHGVVAPIVTHVVWSALMITTLPR